MIHITIGHYFYRNINLDQIIFANTFYLDARWTGFAAKDNTVFEVRQHKGVFQSKNLRFIIEKIPQLVTEVESVHFTICFLFLPCSLIVGSSVYNRVCG